MNKPVLFIHLPRTGGTFISQYIRHRQTRLRKQLIYYGNGYNEKKHQPVSMVKNPDDYFKFGLIRNPFDWYVSRYHYFIDKTRKGIFTPEDDISKASDAGLFGQDFKNRFPDFKDHLRYGLTCPNNFWLSSLHDHMYCTNGQLAMDHVGKMENMNEELNHVLRLNGIEPRIEIKDFWGYRNASERKDYHEYYDEETVRIVLEKDGEILKKYGYRY